MGITCRTFGIIGAINCDTAHQYSLWRVIAISPKYFNIIIDHGDGLHESQLVDEVLFFGFLDAAVRLCRIFEVGLAGGAGVLPVVEGAFVDQFVLRNTVEPKHFISFFALSANSIFFVLHLAAVRLIDAYSIL